MAPASNNFGLRTRSISKAGTFALNRAAQDGHISYASAATLSARWQPVAAALKEGGVKKLEQITHELVKEYGEVLAQKVLSGEISASHAQNTISAVNTVLTLASKGRWTSVKPVADCGIQQRSTVRDVPVIMVREPIKNAIIDLKREGNERGAVVLDLAREFGLRAKEASLINARESLDQARNNGFIQVENGTKGGRERTVPIVSESQIKALEKAVQVQGNARSLVPASQTWVQWQRGGLREAREALQRHGIARIHELRAAYAAERYQTFSGQPIPLHGGDPNHPKDRGARLQVAVELGHGRIDVVSAYIGGCR